MGEPEKKEHQYFQFDPAAFQPLRHAKLYQRILDQLKIQGHYAFYAGLLAYPLTLVTIGVLYGGLVFWTFFAGSMALIGMAIQKMGYSRNFQNWDISLRKFLGLGAAFGLAFGFYLGLTRLKLMFVPIIFAILLIALIVTVKKARV